ncbi:Uncharacterised protein [Vibrio cholerae]|nr:Uncharacterised protein [Vibrio cholerae]CSC79221.1 Uncharacterised protein [Vibrio cholerae]
MAWNRDVIKNPIIQTAVVLEFQSTNRVRNAFERIRNTVCEIVHRIDAPLVTRLVVFSKTHTVQNRITHYDKRRCHIDFCT